MASLISKPSLDEFFVEVMQLSLYGFGSVKEILEMKIWEIKEMSVCVKNEDVQTVFKLVHNYPID